MLNFFASGSGNTVVIGLAHFFDIFRLELNGGRGMGNLPQLSTVKWSTPESSLGVTDLKLGKDEISKPILVELANGSKLVCCSEELISMLGNSGNPEDS